MTTCLITWNPPFSLLIDGVTILPSAAIQDNSDVKLVMLDF